MRIKLLFPLLIPLALWGAVLQLAARTAISRLPLGAAIAIFVFPPLVVCTIWIALRTYVIQHRQKQNALRECEEANRLNAERNAGRQRHDEELRQRRFSCDCRAVAMMMAQAEDDLLAVPWPTCVEIDEFTVDDATASRNTVLNRLRPAVMNTIASVYSACGAAALFPVYVVPPDDVPGCEILELVHAVHAEVLESLDSPIRSSTVPTRFLPAADSTGNALISLFENAPDLPGAVILAFDSPYSRFSAPDDEGSIDPQIFQSNERIHGSPNEGAIALLITNANLPGLLAVVPAAGSAPLENHALIPFWDRTAEPEGYLSILSRLDTRLREELTVLPTLAHIHRAASTALGSPRTGILEMTRAFQGVLEAAQVNCGLIDKPFSSNEAEEMNADRPVAAQCGKLVHNAGQVGISGKRLAALGSAMLYFGIDLSPVDRDFAINVITSVGDLGGASSAGQLALAIAQTANSGVPVLSAEFTEADNASALILMPASADA